jgi:hypothetical protein
MHVGTKLKQQIANEERNAGVDLLSYYGGQPARPSSPSQVDPYDEGAFSAAHTFLLGLYYYGSFEVF